MKRLSVCLVVAAAVVGLLTAACTQAAPAPTPTKPPVAPAPTKAAEPTKPAAAAPTQAPAPQPTAAPAKKVDFPQKGKAITMMVPWDPGGGTDIAARLLAPALEKELGVPVQIVNRAGASGQVGTQEMAKSRPDGYFLGYTNQPGTITVYLDPERKAGYGRKDFTPIANQVWTAASVAVNGDSPFKTLKDLVDAAKANPEKIKASTVGILTNTHVDLMMFEKAAGVRFAVVHFTGAGSAMTALAGGHVDVGFMTLSNYGPQLRSGQFRALGIMDKQESKFAPGVKTLEAQGYKLYSGNMFGITGPAGIPKEIVDTLTGAIKKAMDTDEIKKKMDEMAQDLRYLDAAEYAAYWDNLETQIKPLMADLAKQK